MSLIKKYDGTTFNSVYAVNHYDGTKQFNDNVKPLEFNSIYFDGNGDNLTIPHSTDFVFESGNFTIDFWINQIGDCGGPGASDGAPIFAKRSGITQTYDGIIINISNAGSFNLVASSTGSSQEIIRQVATISRNTQNHVAVVRSGNNWYVFVNGSTSNTFVNSLVLQTNTNYVTIGGESGGGAPVYFNGYLSNVRISKGIARYTSNFTPSKAIPEVDQYTKLLITGESPIVDKIGKTVTVNGNTSSSKAYINSYSDSNNAIYFDGDSDYCTVDKSVFLDLNNSNFTIELQTKTLAISEFSEMIGINVRTYTSSVSLRLYYGTVLFGDWGTGSYFTNFQSNTTLNSNIQYHLAWVKNESIGSLYINGSLDKTVTLSNSTITDLNSSVQIGCRQGDKQYPFHGYMSNIRVSSIARYTSNFNAYRTRLVNDQYTKLLITGESPISDKTGKTVTVYGNTYSTKITI